MWHHWCKIDPMRGAVVQGEACKGRQFMAEVILWASRRYLMISISCRDFERMLLDRGFA